MRHKILTCEKNIYKVTRKECIDLINNFNRDFNVTSN